MMYTYTLWIHYSFNTFFGLVPTWYGVSQSNFGGCTQCDEYNQLAVSIEPVDQGLVSPRGVGDVHIHVMDSVQFQYLFWPCPHMVWS